MRKLNTGLETPRGLTHLGIAPPRGDEGRLHEMGYSNKVLELIKHMYSVDHK